MSVEIAPRVSQQEIVLDKKEHGRTWREMRILWHSVAPYIQSGYGTVTKQMVSRLLNKGFVVFVSAYYGLQPGGIINWNGIYVLPTEKSPKDPLGFASAKEHFKRFKCDLAVFHSDFWVSYEFAKSMPVSLCYSPIDHENYPEKWLSILRAYNYVAVPSRHAENELKKFGIHAHFLPHGVDINIYHPMDKTMCKRSFGLNPEKFIIGIVAANNDEECFDELTEILTRDGWKNYKEISENDFFATLNEKGELEYQKPLRIVIYSGKRKMHLLQTKFLDFCTTLGHEHYVQAFNNRVQGGRTSFRKETSAEIFGKRRCFKKTAIWKGEDVEYFYLPPYKRKWTNSERYYYKPELQIKMDAFLKLIGYYLSEGSCNRYTVFISQNDGRKKEEMLRDLRDLPFKIGSGKGKLWINDVQLASYMRTLGTSASEKRLPRELLNLSSRQLRILWNAIVRGDGWKHCNSEAYSTTSKELADQLQELLLKIGAWGTIIKRKMKKGRIGKRTIKPYSQYIYIIRRNSLEAVENRPSRPGKTFLEKIIDYEGNVWCVEVPNHLVYVRRNGKTMWSGQTRKAWDANFLAVKYFLDNNPDAKKDVDVIVHTNPVSEKGRNLYELAHQIGVEQHIVWNEPYLSYLLGFPESLMCKLYNAMDVFLLLSRREGFCLPALEAQACGVPCILNEFSALIERNDYGRCGWLVKPATYIYSPLNAITSIPDPYKGAEALEEAYNNDSKREHFAKRALECAKQQTWDIAVEKYFLPLLEHIGENIPHLSSKSTEKKLEERKLA